MRRYGWLNIIGLLTFTLGVVVYLIGVFLSDSLINSMASDESDEFKGVATRAITLSFVLFMATVPNYILTMYAQIIGKASLSTFTNIMRGFVLIAVFLFLLPGPLSMHLNGALKERNH